jgi:SpoVK/Ycf46/Vps4 family AAA+-type ATPase
MVDNKSILGLVDCGIKGDPVSFQMLVQRLASKVKKTDPDFAAQLMERLPANSGLRGAMPISPSPVDADSRQRLLIEYYPVKLEHEPVWSHSLQSELNRVVVERQMADRLHESGLVPIRSLLFDGDPGLGKTLAAKWLARELDLPLLVLDLATVMSSFLGKTGSNIRAVLNHASSFPCVLLLDEFDAIAKRRDDDHDVGELKRLVTVLLQAIDDWSPNSILVAATNHGELLDRAVWRRFDSAIHFEYPTPKSIEEYLNQQGIHENLITLMASKFSGRSFSDIEKIVNSIRKRSLLEDSPLIEVFNDYYLNAPSANDEKTLRDIKIIQLHGDGHSQREISRIMGISRPTIRKVIDKLIGD